MPIITNNKNNYVFIVKDMSTIEGLADDGFFGKTEFITDNETYVGTKHVGEDTKTFKFIGV